MSEGITIRPRYGIGDKVFYVSISADNYDRNHKPVIHEYTIRSVQATIEQSGRIQFKYEVGTSSHKKEEELFPCPETAAEDAKQEMLRTWARTRGRS